MLLEELDDFGYGRVDRAAFLTQRLLAVQAAFGLSNYVQWHVVFPPRDDCVVDEGIISLQEGEAGRWGSTSCRTFPFFWPESRRSS